VSPDISIAEYFVKCTRLALHIISKTLPVFFAPPSHASDGTITITGQITSQTCASDRSHLSEHSLWSIQA
jgi:type 1 fimbria pilin